MSVFSIPPLEHLSNFLFFHPQAVRPGDQLKHGRPGVFGAPPGLLLGGPVHQRFQRLHGDAVCAGVRVGPDAGSLERGV